MLLKNFGGEQTNVLSGTKPVISREAIGALSREWTRLADEAEAAQAGELADASRRKLEQVLEAVLAEKALALSAVRAAAA